MSMQPPKWATRFLEWYCNPDLLEEIQGDALELYEERLKREGKRWADVRYSWDVIRFCRWSNVRRERYHRPVNTGAIWNLNFVMAARNAGKNKLIFVVKTVGLSLALAFSLLLTAYVVNELTFDEFHANHERIYRITSNVNFGDHVTHYAVTPLPIGREMKESIPEVENYCRFMYSEKPVYRIGDKLFYNEVTLSADSNFLKVLTFDFLSGNSKALDEPNKIVISESVARKFFGYTDVIGQTIDFSQDISLQITAVIKDVPPNSHLKFDALISWNTFERYDDWSNLNAYTYILLKKDARLENVQRKLPSVLATFHELVAREYNATYEPLFEKITDIHFSGTLDEDIAQKRNKTNLLVLVAVIFLFVITGIINYLNLALAELTGNLRKIGVIRVFGGILEGHRKIVVADTLFTLIVVIPLTMLIGYTGWVIGEKYFSIYINQAVVYSPLFAGLCVAFLVTLFLSTRINSFLLTRASDIVDLLKGKFNARQRGLPARKVLVGVQLSFSIVMMALVILVVDQFHFLQKTDKGFEDKNIVMIKFRKGSYDQIQSFNEELRKISGIVDVGSSTYFPGVLETKYIFQVESETGMKQSLVPMMLCTPEYLELLNIKISNGRLFSQDDSNGSDYVINETAAREFGWKDALGKQIQGPVGGQGEYNYSGEVIGVAKDFNFSSMHSKIEPMVIMLANKDWWLAATYVKMDPLHKSDLITSIERQFKTQWPELPLEWEYLDSKYMSLYEKDNEMKNIFEIGLVISIVISCLGIFSISALLIRLRTKEMGIRKIVGAGSFALFYLHTKSFLQFLLISIAVAWPAIWYLSQQWLKNFAYHVTLNVWYFIIPGMIVLFITVATAGYHGIRCALINPVDTLKHD